MDKARTYSDRKSAASKDAPDAVANTTTGAPKFDDLDPEEQEWLKGLEKEGGGRRFLSF